MASFERLSPQGDLHFGGVMSSSGFYQAVCDLAEATYGPHFGAIQKREVKKLLAGHPVLSVRPRKELEVGMTIAEVDGRRVTIFVILLGVRAKGRCPDFEDFLRLLVARFMPESGLLVRQGAFVGEVILPENSYRVPTPHNGAMYFLDGEKEIALSYLKQFFHPA